MSLSPALGPRNPPLAAVLAAASVVVVVAAGAFAARATGLVNPLYVVSGVLVGLLVGLTGVGGGSLMTPILILAFGFHPASAIGTDLLYASATKTVGTAVHAGSRTVDWRLVARMAAGSVPATVLTVLALRAFNLDGDVHARGLSVTLGVVLAITAAALLFRDRLSALARRRSPELSGAPLTALTVGLGALLGVLITLTSVGAGALGVTLLVFLYPRTPTARIVGSDIAHAVPLTLIAGLAHWWMGTVNFGLLASLLLGSAPGIVLGSLLTPKLPERALRPILSVVLVLVALKLVL